MSDPERAAAVETAWKIHAANTDWTGKVDTKANFIAAIESALIAGTIAITGPNRRLSDLKGGAYVLFWVGLGFLILALALSVWVVRPRLRRRGLKKAANDNYIYFGHLRHWDPDQLTDKLAANEILPVL